MQIPQDQVTQPPTNPVSHHCGPDRPAHDEADSGRLTVSPLNQQMADQQLAPGPAPASDRRGEFRSAAHPGSRRQHR